MTRRPTTIPLPELAQAAGMSSATLRNRLRAGEILACGGGTGGQPYRFTVAEAARWLRSLHLVPTLRNSTLTQEN